MDMPTIEIDGGREGAAKVARKNIFEVSILDDASVKKLAEELAKLLQE